jgi:hypothetical protein
MKHWFWKGLLYSMQNERLPLAIVRKVDKDDYEVVRREWIQHYGWGLGVWGLSLVYSNRLAVFQQRAQAEEYALLVDTERVLS